MTMAEAREDLGIEQREPTAEEKYAKRKAELEAILARNPKCAWARNELKFMEVDDFEKPEYRRAKPWGSYGVCSMAVHCERVYEGGYID